MRALIPPSPGDLPSLEGMRVLVFGLGRFGGGVAVTQWLVRQGARVTVTDSADPETLSESVRAIADLDVPVHLGAHCFEDLDAADLVVVNPSVVKRTSGFFREIVHRNIRWTTEINLFCERCPAGIIGVTGSFGKSTTCAMLSESLKLCRARGCGKPFDVYLGGNIGRSLLPNLPDIRPTDVVVLELSNAQLEDLPRIDRVPELAVITNLHPHHLDRYGSLDGYLDAKFNIVGRGPCSHPLIVGPTMPEVEPRLEQMAHAHDAHVIRVALTDSPIELRVPGVHNQAAAAIVLAVCDHLALDPLVCREALRLFAGLPHRLARVRTLDGVVYVNDSKSTSPAGTLVAIQATEGPIIAIIGGRHRNGLPSFYASEFRRACKLVICVGDSAPALGDALRTGTEFDEHGAVHELANLDDAVRYARSRAVPGDVVLFSPGAPSFDCYVNFEERGRHFSECVARL